MKFIDFFTEQRLINIFNDKILYSNSIGVDKVNTYEYSKNLSKNLKKIVKDIKNKQYVFKPYKVCLIPKNIKSYPRKICVPTIRDRIVIEALKEYIYLCYKDIKINLGISYLINEFVNDYNSGDYNSFIKADLSSYFDTVNNKRLIKKVKKNIDDNDFLLFLEMILKNEQKFKGKIIKNKTGIPQGLSISMLLSNIYLMDVDNSFKNKKNVHYYRYVDDIFIFSKKRVHFNYYKLRIKLLFNKLKINKSKTSINKINHPFKFLGYSLNEENISVKEESVLKLENSIERIFKNYKLNKNKEELLWRLNIRISGAICNNKKYGWLFYFNKINDLKMLYHLDDLVNKFKKRYQVENIDNKTFVKTYYEKKKKNIKNNKYFFNVDSVTKEEKKGILMTITNFPKEDIEKLSSRELDHNYKKVIFKCLKSLEKDLDKIS